MEYKPAWKSKTILFNILAVLVLVATAFGFADFNPDADLLALAAAALNVFNIALRFKTDTGVWLGRPSLE